jgi:hypothetical protein
MNFKKVEGEDYSGRIIWISGKDEDFDLDDCVTFSCGAETSEGFLDDGQQPDETYADIETVLRNLFSDHQIDIELAENEHGVYMNEGETQEDLYNLIKERLGSTNAVEKYFDEEGAHDTN